MARCCWCTTILALVISSAVPAHAESACPEPPTGEEAREQRARSLFEEAIQIEASEPEAALDRLRCAEQLAERPAIALRIGTIEERLGRPRAAIVAYRRYLALAGESAPDRDALAIRIDKLEARIEAERTTPSPDPQPDAPPDDDIDLFWPGVIGGAAGVVLVGVGGALIGVAKAQADDVHGIEAGTVAWNSPDAKDEFESAQSLQDAGIAILVVGSIAAVAGGVLVLTTVLSEPDESTVGVSLAVSPMSAELTATF